MCPIGQCLQARDEDISAQESAIVVLERDEESATLRGYRLILIIVRQLLDTFDFRGRTCVRQPFGQVDGALGYSRLSVEHDPVTDGRVDNI